jgi:hypothetical protein
LNPHAVKLPNFSEKIVGNVFFRFHIPSKENSSDLKNMVVVGTSGGGDGATLNFPHLQDAFPNIKVLFFLINCNV